MTTTGILRMLTTGCWRHELYCDATRRNSAFLQSTRESIEFLSQREKGPKERRVKKKEILFISNIYRMQIQARVYIHISYNKIYNFQNLSLLQLTLFKNLEIICTLFTKFSVETHFFLTQYPK